MVSPLAEELALRVNDLECVPASVDIVFKGHWSLGRGDNVYIFLLRAPFDGVQSNRHIQSKVAVLPNPVCKLLRIRHSR